MTFRLHPNHKIDITQGDSAQLNLRVFNKDSIPWHKYEKEWRPFNFALRPFPDRFTGEHTYDSEGNMVEDSEGNPIDSEGNRIYPIYPSLYDSEGRPVFWWIEKLGRGPHFHPFDKMPSGYHQLQEEMIRWPEPFGIIKLKVFDFAGNTLLELANEDYPDTIFFDAEHTKDIEPGLYMYQVEYITDVGTDTEEVETIQDPTFFEVYKKY